MISAEAAVAAAVSIAVRHGVRVTEPVILKDSFNLRVHLRPAPIVARVPTVTALGRLRPVEALAREVAVVSYLASRGAPVVPPSDLLPPGPFERDGYAVSFWSYAEHDPGARPDAAVAGRLLAELHDALRGYPGGLPYLGPALDETAHLLDRLGPMPGAGAETLAELRDDLGRVTAELSAMDGPTQALHGDAHPGNLLATPAGWRWIDFEETCAGSAGWDLACLRGTRRLDGRAALRAYGADPDGAELRPFLRARRLQGALWMLAKARGFPGEAAQAGAALDRWRQGMKG
ncbi:aminoglycoside phosphotransferase family protein [Sphaerisporangium sp. NPDC051011]|uniref:phosphotransferase enzyme family protein n=1 Tax=Sphaerisporangium sp. NPDC051011 TaxID=3155792 RepID=UPI0034051EC8